MGCKGKEGLDILLIQPPHFSLFEVEPHNIPPIGLLYVASYLRHTGHNVSVYNSDAASSKYLGRQGGHPSQYDYKRYERNVSDPRTTTWVKLRRILENTEPDIVGVSCPTLTSASVAKTAEIVKGFDEDTVLVAGGAEATIRPDELLAGMLFDCAVRGEGEHTMAELAGSVAEVRGLNGIRGLSYKEGGEVVHNPPRKQVADLDALPFPARDSLLELNNYSPTDMGRIITGRGCPHRCNFCASGAVWGGTCRLRSPENVVEEMEEVYGRWGTREFNFLDDTFYQSDERILRICDLIEERDLDITWGCLLRGDRADPGVVARMRKAGLRHVNVGVESGSQAMLDSMNKRLDLAALRKNMRLFKDMGITAIANYIVGYPGETRETLEETKRLIRELDTPYIAELFYPFPGTRAYDELRKSGRLLPVPEMEHNDYMRPVFANDSIDGEYLASEFKKITEASHMASGKTSAHPGPGCGVGGQ